MSCGLSVLGENFDVEANKISNKELDAALKEIISNFNYEQKP